MKDDPRKYWNNIPEVIHSPPSDESDDPIVHTRAEREQEEWAATFENDSDSN